MRAAYYLFRVGLELMVLPFLLLFSLCCKSFQQRKFDIGLGPPFH